MNITGGSQDVTTYFVLRLAATGVEATGLTITNFDLTYVRTGAAPASKVDATALAATDSAHADNKAIEVDATNQPGLYRVDWPDAAFAAGAKQVILSVKCATVFTEHLAVEIDPPVDVTRISGDSGAADNLEAACDGGTYNVGGGAVVAASVAAGVTLANGAHGGTSAVITLQTPIVANATQIEGSDATDQINAAVDVALDTAIPTNPTSNSVNERLKTIDDKLPSKTYLTGTGNSDGDVDMAEATGNFPGTVAKSAATLASTDVSGNLPADVKAWNGGAPPTVGDATAASQSTIAGYLDTEVAAILAAVDTEVGAIKAKTDLIPASPAATGDIPSASTIAAAVGAGAPASESYAADGVLGTRDQILLAIQQLLSERSIAGTTMTVKKLDGSTTAMTFTLNDPTTPTAITRAT